MEIESRLSHLIAKYKRNLEREPTSRVFAPLAECYRKAGMMADALLTLRDGLKHNPDSVLGHIGLAQCYADQGDYKKVYETLYPLKQSNLDNIKLLRLFAESCLKMGMDNEALEAYKYILFLYPMNKEAIGVIGTLEDQVFSNEHLGSCEDEEKTESFPVERLDIDKSEPSADGWQAVDFSDESKTSEEQYKQRVKKDVDEESWRMEPILPHSFKEEEQKDEDNSNSFQANKKVDNDKEVERSFQVLTNEDFKRPKSVSSDEGGHTRPLITHTLVDLYCAQGHYEQAYQLLKKILELNPDDEKTSLKMKEVEGFISFEDNALEKSSLEIEDEDENHDAEELGEEEAHTRLANLVESKVQISKRHKFSELEERLWLFHERLTERSQRQ